MRYKSNVLIYPNGEVLWVPPAIYQSSCTIDVTYFPFDQQTCIMKFGSWTFNGDQVSLALYNNKNFVDLSDYWKSGTWDIIEVPAYLNVYSEGNQPTETDITFYIIIRRKTLFYTVNLILPTVLISFLCVLVFYLPAEAGEKVNINCFLATHIFYMEKKPSTSSKTKHSTLFCLQICFLWQIPEKSFRRVIQNIIFSYFSLVFGYLK